MPESVLTPAPVNTASRRPAQSMTSSQSWAERWSVAWGLAIGGSITTDRRRGNVAHPMQNYEVRTILTMTYMC
jgi:hypothetical protein